MAEPLVPSALERERAKIEAAIASYESRIEMAKLGFSFTLDGDGTTRACRITYSPPEKGSEH